MFNVKYYILLLIFLMAACFALEAQQRHIALIITPYFNGEIALAYRIRRACKNLDWKADIVDMSHTEVLKEKPYDFVISLVPGVYNFPKCKNYLAIFDPLYHYFDQKGFLAPAYRSYDGYLLTYSPSSLADGEKDFTDSQAFPYMLWYPSSHRREFKTVDPKYLFHICCPWGDRYWDKKFQTALTLLDQEPYTRFYGFSGFQFLYPKSYQREIPFTSNAVSDKAAQAGIVLIFHSASHNLYGLPSGKIFEAAAAPSVIICDRNPFVQKHFGDSILYIDTDQDGESIFRQIQYHMKWIKANKEAALKKAEKAHTIYKEKFLLEDQLLRLEEFHNQLLNKN